MKSQSNRYYYIAGACALAVFICAAQLKQKGEREFPELLAESQSEAFSATFDAEAKRKAVIALVEKAADFFEKNRLVTACNAFSHTDEFVDGEVYVFVLDMKGRFIAHPQSELIWKNFHAVVGLPTNGVMLPSFLTSSRRKKVASST